MPPISGIQNALHALDHIDLAVSGAPGMTQAELGRAMALIARHSRAIREALATADVGCPHPRESQPATPTMTIELDGCGKVKMGTPQNQWHGDGVMETASFAGHEMMAITDNAGYFDLHYLGLKTCGFASIEDAKASASVFSKLVLSHMAALV